MKAVVLAAGKGTRLRPLTDEKPKALVRVAGRPLLDHVFEQLIGVGISEFVVVVGYRKQQIIDRYEDAYQGVPITYAHQREQRGLAHALLQAEPYVDAEVDAAFLVEEVPLSEAQRYGVCRTNERGEIVEVVEKPEDPPSNTVMTGFYTFSTAVFHACHLVQPSDRGEYELTDTIDLLLQSGRTIDAIPLDGWRVDVGYPEDRNRVEGRLEASDEDESPARSGGSPSN
jgi:glucose-1-phosphate thymidylyltransferase